MIPKLPSRTELIEGEVNRVLTQYRESPKLLHMIRTYLGQVAEVIEYVYAIPSFFDLDNAVGDQLSLLGKRMGWPRCHCVCTIQPVFGFDCNVPTPFILEGFCEGNTTWEDCGPFGTGEVCITDDEMYRTFLKVRRYQMLSLYSLESLETCIRMFWGEQANVLHAGNWRVVIQPGRALTPLETSLLQIYPRVLPVAPGIKILFDLGTRPDVFGFGEGWGGFCEEWFPDGAPLLTEAGVPLTTEAGTPIITGPLTRGAPWMCEVDPHPYDCPGLTEV